MTDPALITDWATGWAIARAVPPPEPIPGGLRLLVNAPGERSRHILFEPDPARIAAILRSETLPPTALKICAPRPAVAALVPAPWLLEEQRSVMTRSLAATDPPDAAPLPDGLAITRRTDGPIVTVTIHDATGLSIATGTIALSGRHAIADRIATDPAHRRRCLGTRIMAALHRAARERGAETGLLVATPEGRALYRATGWQEHCPYTSCLLRADAETDQNAATSPNTANPTTTQVT